MSSPIESFSVYLMCEYNAKELFKPLPTGGLSADLNWCMNHASFAHKEACEFMVYCGGNTEDFKHELGQMSRHGVSQEFISCIKHARSEGAKWAMFYY